jgi:hypothetical protein
MHIGPHRLIQTMSLAYKLISTGRVMASKTSFWRDVLQRGVVGRSSERPVRWGLWSRVTICRRYAKSGLYVTRIPRYIIVILSFTYQLQAQSSGSIFFVMAQLHCWLHS